MSIPSRRRNKQLKAITLALVASVSLPFNTGCFQALFAAIGDIVAIAAPKNGGKVASLLRSIGGLVDQAGMGVAQGAQAILSGLRAGQPPSTGSGKASSGTLPGSQSPAQATQSPPPAAPAPVPAGGVNTAAPGTAPTLTLAPWPKLPTETLTKADTTSIRLLPTTDSSWTAPSLNPVGQPLSGGSWSSLAPSQFPRPTSPAIEAPTQTLPPPSPVLPKLAPNSPIRIADSSLGSPST